MIYAHYFEGDRCIHCGTTDPNSGICIMDHKTVTIGQSDGTREPFKSGVNDYDYLRARHAELFPPVVVTE